MNQISWHSLAWPNIDPRMMSAQRAVMEHIGIKINYTHQEISHGVWMDHIMRESKSDIVGFFDIDCVPTNAYIIKECVDYVAEFKTFIGLAQVSNHIGYRNHIFAAPCFFLMWRDCWLSLRRPSFMAIKRKCDVAENVSFQAEIAHIPYRALYPTHYEKNPPGSIWNLANYGRYGVGTHYQGGFYHLFNSRTNENIELFAQRCSEIMSGNFSTDGMISSTSLNNAHAP